MIKSKITFITSQLLQVLLLLVALSKTCNATFISLSSSPSSLLHRPSFIIKNNHKTMARPTPAVLYSSASTEGQNNHQNPPSNVDVNVDVHDVLKKNDKKNKAQKKVVTTSTQTAYEYKYKDITEEVLHQKQQQKEQQQDQQGTLLSEKKLLEQTLDHLAFTKGPTHIETMKTLYNLAFYMYHHPENNTNENDETSDVEYAKKFFEICYTQQRSTLGMTHIDTITSFNNLILLYNDLALYDKVKDLVYDWIDLMNENEDDDILSSDQNMMNMDKTTLESLLKIAFTLHRDSLVDDAIIFYELYLKYCNDGIMPVGYDDIDVVSSSDTLPLNKFDNNYMFQNHYHNQDKLSAQHNLAVLYQTKNEYEKAKPLLEACLVQRKMLYGEEDPLTLGTLNNLAALFHKIGDYELSLSLYEYCLELKKKSLGNDHPDTLLTNRNLQRLKKFMGEE